MANKVAFCYPQRNRTWLLMLIGGERGIRTPDTLAGTPDFESGAFSRSASSPEDWTTLYHNAGGEGGIRTHDTLPYTRFPSVRLRPLGHLSTSDLPALPEELAQDL